jgi:hypothetical protein
MRGIQHRVWNSEPLDGLASDDMRGDNLVHILGPDVPIPHGFGIDDHRRPEFALVQTAAFIRSNLRIRNVLFRQLGFEEPLQLALAGGVATTARVACFAGVHANENMFLKFCHEE